jgi:hypothetical protein
LSDFCVIGSARRKVISVLRVLEAKKTMCESSTSFELLNVKSQAYSYLRVVYDMEKKKKQMSCVSRSKMLIRVSISFLSECPKNFVEEKFHKIN